MFQHMSRNPSLRDLFDHKTKLQDLATKHLMSNLSDNGINCQSDKEANEFIHFTREYTDLDLRVADNAATRDNIVSLLLEQALGALKEASKFDLAQPCVNVEVQRKAEIVGFTVTVSLWFFNPDKH